MGSNGKGAVQTLSGDDTNIDRSLQDGKCRSDNNSSGTYDRVVQELCGDLVPESQPMPVQHFYVGTASANAADSDSDGSNSNQSVQTTPIAEDPRAPPVTPAIAALLALPKIAVAPSRKRAGSQEALVDYLRSLLLTSEEYITAMEEKSCRCEEARVQTQIRREQAQHRRREKEEEKVLKNLERVEREAQKESHVAFKARWSKEVICQVGERMQDLVKNPPPLAPGDPT